MQYPWHALHGQTLDVERALTAEGEHLYVITLADGSLTYLPVWMTEDASADSTTLSASPAVSVAGLVALRRLVDALLDPPASVVDAPGRR